ncbi:hypothetical protein Theco_1565 [Thermobacillus composti KWC4]|uniref:Glutamine amidotransferase domain-containing protein n=1 Tax=Thermobacillus composti (strain DSM 18247 / JCM 13945 / KWC4) TaxID=717605 RepID=L0EBR0_THECK|nr:hypothetical protein [Thermobacillus composti]AGA57703.1 hypothetical protein Theco_1565 [Thermobacillus composti KWC4]
MADVLGRWIKVWLPAALAALLALLLLWPDQPAAAAETEAGIEMRWELGFQSVYKEGKYTRLRLTLTNRTGRDLRGDVVFAYDDGFPKEIAVPAELPADTPMIVEMTVPGMVYNKDNNRIRFDEGGAGSGRQVPVVSGQPYLQGSGDSSTTVGVVARDPDTMNVLALLMTRGYNFRTIVLKEDDLPADSLQLGALDMLVLNDVPTGNWPQERIDAIRGWVIRGGRLVVSGGAGYAKTAAAFADLVPVAPGGTAELESARILEAIGEEPLPAGMPMTVSTGDLQAGIVTLADGVPISAVRAYGSGSVLYVAFDPSVEPLAGWGGGPKLWERMLTGIGLYPVMTGVRYGYSYDFWHYDSILSYFPSLKPPKIGHLSLFFIIYVLLAAPILYLLLKKFDRREWMWWLIPVLSVICSVVIFTVGSADKRTVKAHSVRAVQLSGDGWADRSAGAAVFVPSGGKVGVSFEGADFAVPLRDEDLVQSGVSGLSGGKLTRMTDGGAAAEWRDVPYWSIRKAWVHFGASPGYGQFDTAIAYNGSYLDIEVTNQTAADLKHVSVLMNGVAYRIGDLARGESGTVNIPYAGGPSIVAGIGYASYGSLLFPYPSGKDSYARERGLLDAYLNESRNAKINGAVDGEVPLIVGFSSDGEGWFEVNGSAVPSDNVTLWAQPLDLTVADVAGGVPGIVQPVITRNAMLEFGNIHDDLLEMADGTLNFEYPLPWRDEPYHSFIIRQHEPIAFNNATLSVWNDASGEWEPVQMDADSYTLPGPAESYVTDQHTVRMQLEASGRIRYRLPVLELGGGTAE